MTPIHVVGIGLEGGLGLTHSVQQILKKATLLVGSNRHLSYFPDYIGDRLTFSNFRDTIADIQHYLEQFSADSTQSPVVVILTSGDPLFFGLGRLLLAELPPECLTFHPHLSSVQLAFSRVKTSWQDARIVSAHGRSLDEVTVALQQGSEKIAVLTDSTNTPQAIARLLNALDLPSRYRLWVCENLGGVEEQVRQFEPSAMPEQDFAPLNVVILLREIEPSSAFSLKTLPAFGLPDHSFFSFSDRPGLMTKREVRLLVLGELGLSSQQLIWDIGAGTGSVSIEIARLFPDSQIYAIEQTAAGISLIQQNSQRFQVNNVTPIHAKAPEALDTLPRPDRIFIGGSGGNLQDILNYCSPMLRPQGIIVLALATVDHLALVFDWLKATASTWQHRLLQVQISRSVPVGSLTRLTPLNPVTLLTLERTKQPQNPSRP
ncbi:MAG: bifunctional cobalt-precorrin-7 (C(5))-methyltransferase/cobalt-precorrin-6B (C(15))-methyltransferase [Elainellaceae cyanobacterium]